MLRLTVNGRPCEVREGGTLLEAANAALADVPTLCDDPRLEPIGACRLCLVQVAGWTRPVTACNTRAADAMRVQTDTPEIEAARRTILRLLARQYPAAPVGRFPDKPFHRLLRRYGLAAEAGREPSPPQVDDSHPYIHVDMSQCVHCLRCVRICSEVQGQFVWRVWGRGDTDRIRPDGDNLLESPCVGCGACVDTCPTGALEDRATFENGHGTEWTRTTCPYCGTGCEMYVGTSVGRIVGVKPALDAPVNKGHLCVKGRYAYGFNDAPDRVTEPMIREGAWKKVTWEEAISFTADTLANVLARHGPDSVGILGSARATNEENYLTQKFARVVIGTNNVDCCARVCHAPSAAAMAATLGTGAATNSFDDIEAARAILVCGANPTENHPVVGARIKQAVLRGAKLIVIDPRRIELVASADIHLPLRVGTNVPLLNALACTIVEDGLYDADFIRARVAGWDEFRDFIRAWTPERAAAECGVDPETVRKAARLYATTKPAMMFHGLGVTEQTQGTEGVECLVNLALLCGNVGKPGSGVNPLRGQNNVQGAAHMGCDPAHLTGAVPVASGKDRFERVWGAPVPTTPGLNLMTMIDAANDGHLKALWAIGYDIARTNADLAETRKALESLELVILQDLFLNDVADFATVFLPATSSFEKDGTFMNSERRVQRVRRALGPRGSSRPDWRIICDVARAMGHGKHFAYESPRQIWDEIRSVWPVGSGITYERLERGGLQWPCPSEDDPGTAILHRDIFPRTALQAIDYVATPEKASAEFPFLLNTGRTLYQFNAGTMTARTPNAVLRWVDYLDISPEDASRLGIGTGSRVLVRSRYGSAELIGRISPTISRGELFATFHTPQAKLNALTGHQRDRHVDTPEYKVTAVTVDRIADGV
jgi:formate dehydrogenase major subunit